MIASLVMDKARPIRLVLTDCDGVLTDGGVYYSERGEELKRFLIRDGMGVERLKKLASERPLGREYWVAASCHSDREVEQAMRIGVDFVMISPVYETRSHPAAPSLGWHGFAGLVERSKAPAYALGGVKPHHLRLACHYGGQGLAMISGIWDAADPADAVRCTLAPFSPSHHREGDSFFPP